MPANLKYSKPGQERNVAASQIGMQPQPKDERDSNSVEQALPLPPFPVLLQWLEYYHTRTGVWPEPEAIKSTSPNQPESDFTANAAVPSEKPLLKLLPGKPQKHTGTKIEDIDLANAGFYNLRASVYYHAALSLSEKHYQTEAGIEPLSEPAVLTLASLMAWCSFPAFIAEYSNKGCGMGMYISLEQWSKTLKIRKATLGNCLKELEAAGLVEICEQTATRFYRLRVAPEKPLPIFDPAAASGDNFNEVTFASQPQQQEAGFRPEPSSTQFPATIPVPADASMYMSSQNHVNFKNTKKHEPVNHEHGSEVEPGTTAGIKYAFLVQKASFPGYASPEGLTTLDSREAQKFASNPLLSLKSIEKVYHQVLSAWTSGKCTRNPIGFFHHSLTRHLSQNVTGDTRSESAKFFNLIENVPGTAKPVSRSSRFPVQAANSSCNKDGTGLSAGDLEVAGEHATAIKYEVDEAKVRAELREHVIQALHNRFRQPSLAQHISQLEWGISFTDNKLNLELTNYGTNYVAVPPISQSDRALLKIAVSQGIRAIIDTGYSCEIEITA